MSLPYMPMYWGDYSGKTGHLSTLEHGAYLLMLKHCWSNASGLPKDERRLQRITGLTPDEWAESRDVLLAFFRDAGDHWENPRVTEELTKAEQAHAKRVEAGRRGGKAKARLQQCSSNATAMLKQPEPEVKTRPTTNNHRPQEQNNVPLTDVSGRSPPPPAPEQADYFKVVCKAAGVDTKMLAKGDRLQASKLAKELRGAGVPVTRVESHGAEWWRRMRETKRGGKVSRPTWKQLRTHFGELLSEPAREDPRAKYLGGEYAAEIQH